MKKLAMLSIGIVMVFLFSVGSIAQSHTKLSDFPEHVKEAKPFKRMQWFHQQRAFPDDTIPGIYANKVYNKEAERIMKKKMEKGNNSITWYPLGPDVVLSAGFYPNWGWISGRTRALAVDPTDHNTVYIGAACGGLWKSTDGGTTWQDIGRELATLSYGAIAVDPNNPDIVYAGSGEPIAVSVVADWSGKGLFKSMDGGETWINITDGFGEYTHFADIIVSPFDSDILFAAMAGGSTVLGTGLPNEGIWKSTDAGETWNKCLDLPFAFDVMLHPNDPDIVYAAIGGMTDLSGFYISEDLGETWTQNNEGLQEPASISRMQFDISISDPNMIYCVIYDMSDSIPGTGPTRAYKSLNGGLNWDQISEGVNLGGYYSSLGWYDQGWYDLCIAVDPINPNHVLIGNIELHKTTNGNDFYPLRDGGNTAIHSVAHVDYHRLAFAPSNPGYLYIVGDGGIYCTTDGGISTESKNLGLETLQFYRMGSHPEDPGSLIGGTQDNGTILTENGGLSWVQRLGGDGMECFYDPQHPDTIYASFQNGNFRATINGGMSWLNFGNIYGAWVTPFFPDFQNPESFFTANSNIQMRDWSSGWQPITTGLTEVLIVALDQSRVNPNNMIMAGDGNEISWPSTYDYFPVMISTDGGYTWTDVTDNIPGEPKWVPVVITHPTEGNTMFIVRCGFSEENKILKTTDLGESWTNVSGDLPDIPCNDLFIDPENTNHYYVGTDLGVYRSENEGENWEFAGFGMPNVPVLDFDYVMIENTGYLRVATHGRSIYEAILYRNCLPDGITFINQEQIDNFQIEHEYCTVIEGDVTINGTDITNLDGLAGVTSIGGNLTINSNESLESITGLENLESIGGNLSIFNNNLLSGLIGLDYLDPWSINDLIVNNNESLCDCDVESICAYLSDPGGTVMILNNATGCNSIEEVQEACFTEIKETLYTCNLKTIPNPIETRTVIAYSLPNNSYVELDIIDVSGRSIVVLVSEYQQQGDQRVVFRPEKLKPGIYLCRLKTDSGHWTIKIIKL